MTGFVSNTSHMWTQVTGEFFIAYPVEHFDYGLICPTQKIHIEIDIK
jgi:hypothetical protein